MKTIIVLTTCIFMTACVSTIKKDNNDLYTFANKKWSKIETTDGKSYESFPPKLNVKLKGSDKWQYILEKNAKPLAKHIEANNLRVVCDSKKSEIATKWKWQKNNLMIQCGKKDKWKKATLKNIDYNTYWR